MCVSAGATTLKQSWLSMGNKPAGAFSGVCGQALALIDCTKSLPANSVVIMVNGN